jgi:hypothetical protein
LPDIGWAGYETVRRSRRNRRAQGDRGVDEDRFPRRLLRDRVEALAGVLTADEIGLALGTFEVAT